MTETKAITLTDDRDLILREAHEKMGFHTHWPAATKQLAALVEATQRVAQRIAHRTTCVFHSPIHP